MPLVTDCSLSLQVRLHSIQEKVFSKDWEKNYGAASAACSPITCVAGVGNLRRREKFRGRMRAREEKGEEPPALRFSPRALQKKKKQKQIFLLVSKDTGVFGISNRFAYI